MANIKRKAVVEEERKRLLEELRLLGVPWEETCVHERKTRDLESGELVERPCGRDAVLGEAYCGYHRPRSLVATVETTTVLREMKESLTRDLLPKALLAVDDVLENPDASDQNKLRAATIVMDRGGLPAGQDVNLQAVVAQVPPAEMLARALADVRERLGPSQPIAVGTLAASDDSGGPEAPEPAPAREEG